MVTNLELLEVLNGFHLHSKEKWLMTASELTDAMDYLPLEKVEYCLNLFVRSGLATESRTAAINDVPVDLPKEYRLRENKFYFDRIESK